MKGNNVVIKTRSKAYEVPVDGVLRWSQLGSHCVFHISPLEDGSLEIYVASDNNEPRGVEFGAHEIKPKCPTCGKEN